MRQLIGDLNGKTCLELHVLCNSLPPPASPSWIQHSSPQASQLELQQQRCGQQKVLSVVELRGDPGQSPLQVGEHELERLGPLLLRVELGFDGVRSAAAARVFDLALLHVHPGGQRGFGVSAKVISMSRCSSRGPEVEKNRMQ